MALNRREILKFCGFIALNTAIYFVGVTIFMFLEYHYVKDPPVQNAIALKETIESKIDGKLNASQFKSIFDSVDAFVSTSKSCSTPKYKQGWKKELTKATFARWSHFTTTVVTTIGKYSLGFCFILSYALSVKEMYTLFGNHNTNHLASMKRPNFIA